MFVETVKTALHLEACTLPHWNGLQKGKTGHTGLLLVTANEQSTAQGNTWGLTLTPGICDHLNTFLDYLGDLDDMEDYMKTTLLNAN